MTRVQTGPLILVVEDDPNTSALLTVYLEREGY
jgi:DNA-binding response OmpR family regulator